MPPADRSEPARVEDLVTINRVLRALLVGGDDLDAILDRVMGEVMSALRAERGYLVLERGAEMDIRAVRNWTRDEISGGAGEISRSIASDVFETGRPVLLQDALQSSYGQAESVQALQLQSVLAAPLPSAEPGARPLGVLYLEARSSVRRFTEAHLTLLTEILELSGRVIAGVVRRLNAEQRARSLESALLARDRFPGIITGEPVMLELLRTVAQIATSDVPVLVLGESGTGKELIARAVHLNSARAEGPFVPVNCGAFTEALLESELFGHTKGAFTGALKDRGGVLEAASGGTLFLDEVGEMPPTLQVKLLRVVQFGEYKPVGSDGTRRADVRFVSATNRDLEAQVRAGTFRQDLLFRLNTITLELPPLRERLDDIPVLFQSFCQRIAERRKIPLPRVSDELMPHLLSYSWPGNVREFENEVERLMALSTGRAALEPTMLSQRVLSGAPANARSDPRLLASRVDEEERAAILEALDKEANNRTRAAKRLGISRETLRVKMRKLGLS